MRVVWKKGVKKNPLFASFTSLVKIPNDDVIFTVPLFYQIEHLHELW